MTSLDALKQKILLNPEAKAEYEALLKAEQEKLKVNGSTLIDKSIGAQG